MRAYMWCRSLVKSGLFDRNGIVQDLPAHELNRKRGKNIGRHTRTGDRRGHYSSSNDSGGSSTTASSSGFASNDSASSNTTVNSAHTRDDDLYILLSSTGQGESPGLRKIVLINKSGLSMKKSDSIQVAKVYRQSLKEFDQTSVSPQDLTQALESHNYTKTRWLLERSFDQIAVQEYSWLNELLKLGFSPLEITDELMEKAIQGSWIREPFEEPCSEFFTLGLHHSNCVHVESPNQSILYTGHSVDSEDSIYTSSAHSMSIIVSGPGGDVQGGNNLQPGFRGLHGDMESPSASEMEFQGVTLTARQRVEYFCGLGGVRPAAAGNNNIEFGSVSFREDNSMASITLDESTDNITVIEVLDSLDRAAGELQRLGACCDSFSILVDSASKDYVELHQIPFGTIRRLRELVLGSDLTMPSQIFDLFGIGDFIFPQSADAGSLKHWVSVATQFLALGLLSYAQAHCGPIQPFFLDTPLKAIYLLGTGTSKSDSEALPTLTCYLVELTCMGDMLGQPVLAFGQLPGLTGGERPLISSVLRRDVLASPVDILDTWGPGGMIASEHDSKVLFSIFVGGGTITSTGNSHDSSTVPRLHWRKPAVNTPTPTSSFPRDAKALIGTTILENNGCQAAAARLRNSLPMLEEIGTFPTYWELMERQLGLGIQGGQAAVAILQFNQTWVKMMGTTKKSAMLSQRSIYISDLDSMFGVQVSICTGIARRVRLRDLLADLLPAYVSGLLVEPLLWGDLIGKYDALAALRGSDLRQWLESLDHPCRAEFEGLIFAVLYLLRDTGIDRKGDQFVIACVQSDLPFQCFKMPCKNENYWARMLIDSEDSATFAYVTTQCLETAALKCSRPSPLWGNSTALLGTAVSQDRVAAAYALAAAPGLGQWTLKENDAYLIGRSDKVLYVQVKTPSGLDPHLLVSLSTIPPEFLKRLFRKGKPKRLREKKCFDSYAESVVICVEKTGP